MMQGYDIAQATAFIAAALRKAGHKRPQEELEAFARRAIDADLAYMVECGALDEEGYMGDGEYDEDDAFEVLLDVLGEGMEDNQLDELAQMLDSYMEAQQAFMENSGLLDA